MTLHHRKESPDTLETLTFETKRNGQAIAAPLRDDGLPLVVGAVVCLFGS